MNDELNITESSVKEDVPVVEQPVENTLTEDIMTPQVDENSVEMDTIPPMDNPVPPTDENRNPIPLPEGEGGFNIPFGGSGGGQEYNKVFDIQKEIFENFDKDIMEIKNYVDDLGEDVDNINEKIKVICEYIDKNNVIVNEITKTFRFMFLVSFGLNIITIISLIILAVVK